MATYSVTTDSSSISSGKDALAKSDCGICHRTYSNPRLLPCLHSYCQQCIADYKEQNLFTTEEGKEAFRCPNDACQTLTFECGTDFIENLHLVRESKAKEKVTAILESEKYLCDMCDEEEPSIAFCESCYETMCRECAKFHQRFRKTKAHKVVTLESTQSSRVKRAIMSHFALTPSPCPKHPKEVLKFYCMQCSQVVCVTCVVVSHSGHKCSTIEDMTKDTAKLVQESVDKLNHPSVLLQKSCDDIAEMKRSVTREGKMVLKEIKDSFDKLKSVINAREATLTRQCEEIMQSKQARLDLQAESLQKLEAQIAFSTQFASSSTRDHKPDELMTQSTTILNRLKALADTFAKEHLTPCTSEGILHKIEIEGIIKTAQQLGSVVEGCHPPNCILEINPPGKPISCNVSGEKRLRLVTRGYQDEEMTHGGEAVKAEITNSSQRMLADIRDNHDGTYQVSFEIPSRGQYRLSVTVRNQNVRGSPFEMVVRKPSLEEQLKSKGLIKPVSSIEEPIPSVPIASEPLDVEITEGQKADSCPLMQYRCGPTQIRHGLLAVEDKSMAKPSLVHVKCSVSTSGRRVKRKSLATTSVAPSSSGDVESVITHPRTSDPKILTSSTCTHQVQ